MKILIGADKGGFRLKEAIALHLKEQGVEFILVCGTGMGMAVTANKFKSVRAAVVESQYAAAYSRKINDANVLCLGGFIIGDTMGCEIADAFLSTGFVEGFPQWRVDFLNSQKALLAELETKNFK